MTLGICASRTKFTQTVALWFIAVFVDGLDPKRWVSSTPAQATGWPPYSPYDLVKLYIYGYLNGIRSSRRLMRECRRNVELFLLLNRLCPDFRTIADFRKRHKKLLKKIFLIFVQACREMKLMDAKALCMDGTTIRAVNGKKQATSAELSRKKLEYARAQLEAMENIPTRWTKNDFHEADRPSLCADLDRDRLPTTRSGSRAHCLSRKCRSWKKGRKSLTFTT